MNWVQTSGISFTKAEAVKAKNKQDFIDKIKEKEGKHKIMVKVSDRPLTYKEIWVDD